MCPSPETGTVETQSQGQVLRLGMENDVHLAPEIIAQPPPVSLGEHLGNPQVSLKPEVASP